MIKKVKLSERPQKHYSRTESQLFDLMPQGGKRISSVELTEAREAKGNWKAEYKKMVVMVTMNNLIKKIDLNQEPFVLRKERSHYHDNVEYWIEDRRDVK